MTVTLLLFCKAIFPTSLVDSRNAWPFSTRKAKKSKILPNQSHEMVAKIKAIVSTSPPSVAMISVLMLVLDVFFFIGPLLLAVAALVLATCNMKLPEYEQQANEQAALIAHLLFETYPTESEARKRPPPLRFEDHG